MRTVWLLSLSAASFISVTNGQDDSAAWLAVINGEQEQPIVPQQPIAPQQPIVPRPPPPVGGRRSQLSAPPPLRNQPPLQPAVRPQRPRPLPGRRPPPPQKSPPPPQKSGGIIDGIRDTITGAVGDLNCAAQNLYAEDKLEDPAFINYQMQCLLDRGECDDIGNLVKRMAPDIIRGGCPPPCDECKKKQIQKVMATLSRKYPKQFHDMLKKFGNKRF